MRWFLVRPCPWRSSGSRGSRTRADGDALAAEPGGSVRVTADPDDVATADLMVLPGSRSTLSDLEWMRSRGLNVAVTSPRRQRC